MKTLTAAVPVVLAVGAVLIYGLLVLAYSEFYRELGVRPTDVGLDFGRGIGGAAGITIALAAVAGVASLAYLVIVRVRKPTPGTISKGPLALVALAATAFVVIFGIIPFARFANSRADQVKRGVALEPVGFLGIEMLAVRADPARLEPVDASKSPTGLVERVRNHTLFYLGRSGPTIVLYDQTTQRVLHLPTAAVTLETSNCETNRNEDPACTRLREPPRPR